MGRVAPATSRDEQFRLRDVALAAYGPTVVNSIGHGAVLPVLALRARDLGADVSTAALVVGLLGIGTLLASLPSGALVARIGERRALFFAGLLEGVALLGAAATSSVLALGAAVMVTGAAWSVFLIARQGFIIDAVPPAYRARALSTLGGSHRVGIFVGPLLGAGVIHVAGLRWVFVDGGGLLARRRAARAADAGPERRRPGRARSRRARLGPQRAARAPVAPC